VKLSPVANRQDWVYLGWGQALFGAYIPPFGILNIPKRGILNIPKRCIFNIPIFGRGGGDEQNVKFWGTQFVHRNLS